MSGETQVRYAKAERDKKRKLLQLYFESEGLDKEDAMHEIIVENLEKHGVQESHKPHLEKIKALQEKLKQTMTGTKKPIQEKLDPSNNEGERREWTK